MVTEANAQVRQAVTAVTGNLRNQQKQSSAAVKESAASPEVRQGLPTETESVSPAQEAKGSSNRPLSPEQLDKMVDDLNSFIQDVRRELRFSVDRDSGQTIIKVIDSKSQQVVRQIPPEDIVGMAELLDGRSGLLMRTRV
ncbi:MAG: flagellar protein FlaG [Gammaproteobacteria bacterium]|nr:flagellar protein FlaG [Gammaproteobacteria bacterium]